MRDLSQSSFSYRPGSQTGRILRIVLTVGLVLAGFYFGSNFFLNKESGGASVILREAPRGLLPVAVGDSAIDVEGGVALSSQTASMRDVRYGGEATATVRRSFGGGIYILSVDATLPDPKNVKYEVWLVGASGAVPVDFMKGSKTSWSLSLRDTDKFSSYNGVWITLERSYDELPEEHIMEGTF